MNYANIKYCDIANGPRRAHQPVRLGVHPPVPRLLQRSGLGFCLRRALHQGGAQPDLCILPARLHRRAVPAGGRARWSRPTSGSCCPSCATSRRCTPARRCGATRATPSSSCWGRSPPAAGARPPTRCWLCWTCWWTGPFIQAPVRHFPALPGQRQPAPAGYTPAPSPKASPSSGRISPSFPPYDGLTIDTFSYVRYNVHIEARCFP